MVLNGQSSKWLPIKAGVPQGSILGPLLFLVYINDLPEGLTTSAKLFADDTSLFSVVHDSAASSAFLNDDLLKISRWVYQWGMIFNPDASKQAQEIVFSRKANASNHETVYFNNVPAIRENIKKHLGLFVDSKLSFFDHINEKIKKVTKQFRKAIDSHWFKMLCLTCLVVSCVYCFFFKRWNYIKIFVLHK